jgi:hypothetical protein
MDDISLGHLYAIVEECEKKCNKCGLKMEHLVNNAPYGIDGWCNNMIQKDAAKRVIAKRLGRINGNTITT